MSNLVGAVNGSRLGHAINDCLQLLQLSSDELHWALGSVSGNGSITARSKANVVAWLTAALTNQDTCLRGLLEVADFFELIYEQCVKMVEASIERAPTDSSNISIVADDAMASLHGLIESPVNGTGVDVVVATDGNRNFTTITEAVRSAPDYSDKRYVIYGKKGIYEEHVVVPRQKKNLMILGDSMFDTIITGNRRNYDGWSTFGSASFGESSTLLFSLY
ncbi:pectinesterase/pectinesterase inhibitor PPE8B isoform X1 [Phoenix dactylifera]|uniref:Pectinesterase/pectinesterase inhibitor PPE8B isoform X1 n=1 Tax=Phoenix dactylifera TaxID=42345 RepID=A0A8B9ACE3_PHODC|nr:pectinesterase/pectinesterase inhibitor PPE8B isoform X1 [Phoenix dactylifera]